jgi:hypothetical protein
MNIIFVAYPEEGGREFLQNVCKNLQIDTQSCTIRFSLFSTKLHKSQRMPALIILI